MEINLLKFFTVKRLVNAVKIVLSFHLSRITRKPIVWGVPLAYMIEPTNHCNLKCPECPSGLGALTRPMGLLKFDDFKKLIDEVKDRGFYVQLFFQGEPYINKELPRMIKYAQENKMYVSISTNGHFITEKNVDNVLENAPDKLVFSIDGLDEESYQIYRSGGTFAKADEGIRLLAKRKKEKNKKLPFIDFQFIMMKHNEHQFEDVKKYCKDNYIDKVTFKSMQVTSYDNALKFLPSNEKYRRYIVKDNSIKIKGKLKNHCFPLWRTSVMTWDGKVVPCCFDKDADFQFGTLNGKSFESIWRSDKYYGFRQRLLNNRNGIGMCTNCIEGLKVKVLEIES